MFGYNDNKQAFIKDVNAGTYRQLVEAAETCQVAIIHPGKPRNPNEPGLDELTKRAEAFQLTRPRATRRSEAPARVGAENCGPAACSGRIPRSRW